MLIRQGACKEQWGSGGSEPWGLKSYKGLIFGCWDETTPDLRRIHGRIAWYLDGVIDRRPGGTENYWWCTQVEIDCNWKFAAEQFASNQITLCSHTPLAIQVLGRETR